MTKKTCFVISPIGQKDSPERVLADDLYELLVEPALERFEFSVIRADKIQSSGSITSEIIQYVQNADLCVIDITGHNPNVMYECGRRHETGKPFIMLAREGEKLPFDINTLRTVFYSVANGREIRTAVRTIQGMVEKMLADGLAPISSGESLSTISDSLKRIERKLDGLDQQAFSVVPSAPSGTEIREILRNLSPLEAFALAESEGNPALADAVLPRLKVELNAERYLKIVARAVYLGSGPALRELQAVIDRDGNLGSMNHDAKQFVVGAYVSRMVKSERGAEALAKLSTFFDTIANSPAPSADLSGEQKAFYLNQHTKILYALGKYADAAALGDKIIALNPSEVSYYYNHAGTLDEMGRNPEALTYVDKYMALLEKEEDPDSDHLTYAIHKYVESNRISDARRAFDILRRVNPFKATLVSEHEAVSRAFS